MVELYEHNKKAVEAVKKHFTEVGKKAAVVHATGTSKALISATISQDYKSVLILAPNKFVLNETKKWCGANVEFRTYLSNMYNPIGKYDLIIFDEFHRAGAPQWGQGVAKLIENNSQAYMLGVSATPIRYLDNERNMVDELFEGNVVSLLTLADAMKQGILPTPIYVSSIYDFENDSQRMRDHILNTKRTDIDDNKKQTDINKLVKVTHNWINANGVPTIIRKYFDKGMRRIIVFTSEVGKFEETRNLLSKWFTSAGYSHLDYYQINYTNPYVDKEMARFQSDKEFERENNPVQLKIAISVDMLNEGVHIPRVDGIIMLRGTISRIIIEQQIGRCLTADNKNRTPIVLDLVNNMDSIRFGSVDYSAEGDGVGTSEVTKKDYVFPFKVIDECRDIRMFYQQIEKEYQYRTSYSVKERIEMVKNYVALFGKQPPKEARGEYREVRLSYAILRQMYNHGKMDIEDCIEFEKILEITDYKLIDKLDLVVEFIKEKHRTPHSKNEKEIYNIYSLAQNKKRHGTIKADELAKYELALSYIKDQWLEKYAEPIDAYIAEYGHFPTESDNELYRATIAMRVRRNLPQERREWLESRGFKFERTIKRTIQEKYDEAVAYLEENDWQMPMQKDNKAVAESIGDLLKYSKGQKPMPRSASLELQEKILALKDKIKFRFDIEERLSGLEKVFKENGRINESDDRRWLRGVLERKDLTEEQKARVLRILDKKKVVPVKIIDNASLVEFVKKHGLPTPKDRRMYNTLMKFRKCDKNGRYPAIERDPETYAFLQTYGFDCHAKAKDNRPIEVRLNEIIERVKANGCLDDNARGVYYSAKDRHANDERYAEFFQVIESYLDKNKSNWDRQWTDEEVQTLIDYFANERRKFSYKKDLMRLFPNRTMAAINARVGILKREGKISDYKSNK